MNYKTIEFRINAILFVLIIALTFVHKHSAFGQKRDDDSSNWLCGSEITLYDSLSFYYYNRIFIDDSCFLFEYRDHWRIKAALGSYSLVDDSLMQLRFDSTKTFNYAKHNYSDSLRYLPIMNFDTYINWRITNSTLRLL